MTECNEKLIKCLNCFMNDKSFPERIEKALLMRIAEKAGEQKLIPAVYFAADESFRSELSAREYEKIRQTVFISTVSQMQRTAELVRVCRLLDEKGIRYIVFKGAVLRAMYKNSDYRISSDEDLLVKESDIAETVKLLCENGYEVSADKEKEVKLINRKLKSVLEIHSSVAPDDRRYDEINSALNSQLDSSVYVNVGAGEVRTFSPTYGFLSLCVHFYNHFILSGIGIRQVMDIACFYKNYSHKIDFDYVFQMLEKIRAAKLIDSVLAIGERYFDVEYHGKNEVSEKLLDELLNAGIYGTADMGRVHSGTLTANLAKENKRTVSSLISSVFPSKESIVKNHPELKGRDGEINKYRFERIIKFAGGKGKLKTLSCAEQRKKLFKELDIID